MMRPSLPWLLPLALLVAGTLFFRLTEADLAAARGAFEASGGIFFSSETGFWGFLYRVAAWPAIALGLAALGVLAGSLKAKACRPWRRQAAFLLLALAIGPGLLVNTTLKDHYGRPRPRQVETLGGAYPFLPVLQPGPYHDGRSFASGHASIAFFALTPFFLLWSERRRLAWVFLGGGLAWGALVGLARILQGGHWPSDVLWAGAIVYFTGWVLARAFGFFPGAATATR